MTTKKQEVTTAAPTAIGAPTSVEIAGRSFKVVDVLTRPLLKFEDHDNKVAILIDRPMHRDEDADGHALMKGDMEAPYTMVVIDLNDGEVKDLIVPTVLHSELLRNYPGIDQRGDPVYVGKMFFIERYKGVKKKYWNFKIAEIAEQD